ncbi:MAG: hypothetical protein AB1630_05200 [bacterium]
MKIFVLFLLLSVSIFAKDNETRETSAAFLRMGVGARALSMGGALFRKKFMRRLPGQALSTLTFYTRGKVFHLGFVLRIWEEGLRVSRFQERQGLDLLIERRGLSFPLM